MCRCHGWIGEVNIDDLLFNQAAPMGEHCLPIQLMQVNSIHFLFVFI